MYKLQRSLKNKIMTVVFKIINFGLVRRKRKLPKNIKKILIIKGDHIGDAIISTVCLLPLKENYPDSQIDVICGSWAKIVYQHNSKVRRLYIIDNFFLNRKNQKIIIKICNYVKQLYFNVQKIRKEEYDLCILLRGQLRGNMVIISNFFKAKYIIGFSSIGFSKLLDLEVKYNEFIQEKENFLNLLKNIPKFNLKNNKYKYDIEVNINKQVKIDIKNNKKFKIILNFEGYELGKKIKAEKIIDFILKLKEFNIEIYIITPPNSSQIEIIAKKIKKYDIKNTKILEKCNNLFELFYYLENCDLLISVDTSIIHMASIVVKRIIGLYYPDDGIIQKFAPDVEEKYIVKSQNRNLNTIDFKQVLNIVIKILEREKITNKKIRIERR